MIFSTGKTVLLIMFVVKVIYIFIRLQNMYLKSLKLHAFII